MNNCATEIEPSGTICINPPLKCYNTTQMNPTNEHDDIQLVPATGILGHGIGYSLSPMLHAAADMASGRMTDYNIFDFPPGAIEGFLERALEFGEIVGFNVTTPYKEVLFSRLGSVHAQAQEVGAVNTVKVEKGTLVGYNTDRPAFAASLTAALNENNLPHENWKVVIMGAGGAARAVIYAILDRGIAEEIILMNRSEDRKVYLLLGLDALCRARGVKLLQHDWLKWSGLDDGVSENHRMMLINATSLGTMDSEGRIKCDSAVPRHDLLSKFSLVFDLVYSPPATRLVQAANNAGVLAVGGGRMLVEQAVLSRAIWFGNEHIASERDAMISAYNTWAAKNASGMSEGDET